jgi:hypothetical protein
MTKAALVLSADKRAPVTGEGAPGGSEEPPEAATCDYRACAARYQSFDADDCTYQPYGGGQRRQCPLAAKAAAQSEFTTRVMEEAAPSSDRCNIEVCAETYSSFRREDCTYQPYDGGARRLCQR